AELFTLLEKHIGRLVRIAKDDFPLSRLRRQHLDIHYQLANWHSSLESELELGIDREVKPKPHPIRHRIEQKLETIARYLPDRSKNSEVANDLLHSTRV